MQGRKNGTETKETKEQEDRYRRKAAMRKAHKASMTASVRI